MKYLKKLLENKKLLFLLVFLYGSVITIFLYYPSYVLDGYCQLAKSYSAYAENFFIAGRFLTAFIWIFFDIIKIPHDVLSVLTQILSITFLSLSVVKIYTTVKPKIADNVLYKLTLLLGSSLIIFNPFTEGILIFEEAFCMSLSVYISILAAIKIGTEINKRNFIVSLIMMICANFLYQGSICYFIPIVILVNILNNQKLSILDYIKENYKKIIIYALVFGISCIIEFISLQLYVNLTGALHNKVGNIDFIKNLFIIRDHIRLTNERMQSVIHAQIFRYSYTVLALLILSRILVTFKKDYKYIFYIGLVASLTVLAPFVPNLVMKTDLNYTSSRLLLSFGALIGFLIVGSTLLHEKREKKINNYYLLLVLIIGSYFFVKCSCSLFYNTYKDFKRYKSDIEYLEIYKDKVKNYEKDNNIKVKTIYYDIKHLDRPNYPGVFYNFNNVRVSACTWGLECALQAYIDKDLKVKEMKDQKANVMLEQKTDISYEKDKIYIIFR